MNHFRRTLFLLASTFALTLLPASGATLDVVFNNNQIGDINDLTGTYQQLGTLPFSGASGIGYVNGTMYVEDSGTDIYSVNTTTGASHLVGATGISDSAAAFAGGSDGLYEVDFASNLYKFNTTTGQGTLVGATGLAANNGQEDTSLATDGTSLYYTAGAGGANQELYRISITTGVATDLGNTGITGVGGSGYSNGKLELYQYGQSTNYVYSATAGSLNFTRGTALTVQAVTGGAVGPATTPEPQTLLLMGGGFLLMGCIGRRRRQRKSTSTDR